MSSDAKNYVGFLVDVISELGLTTIGKFWLTPGDSQKLIRRIPRSKVSFKLTDSI